MKSIRPYLLTGAIVLIAFAVILLKYRTHLTNPWTRDGQVQANVIEIAPRVSGPIVALPLRDNQFVRAGDLLFEIDPRTYQANLDQARALFDQSGGNVEALTEQVESAKAGVEVARASINQARSAIAQVDATITKNKAELERQQSLLPKKATSQKSVERAQAIYDVSLEEKKVAQSALLQSESNLLKAKAGLAQAQATLGALGDLNPQFRQAQSALQLAQLNLEFTQVRAPTNGYVTNLRLRIGSHVVANQPSLALVDTASYWVDGYFKENRIAGIQSGDRAVVTLMTYPDRPIEGVVDSIGWGISQQDGSTAANLLPRVSPTFEWIRLAQRIPVRVQLVEVPEEIKLRVGTTCSVLVRKGSADGR
ncbi:MAG: HlyD family secretion protein [Desulfobacterales bacterium]